MTELIWKGSAFEQRNTDDFVCLTQMAKIFSKNVKDWTRTESTKAYIDAVSSEVNICPSQLLVSLKGNSGNFEQGTWAHPLIAIAFAQWLSPEFHVWCNLHIKHLIEQSAKPQPAIIVTTEDIRVQASTIKYFTDCGDLQLAQLLKNKLGNALLAEQQMLPGTTAPQLEGAVDVAIRLGFQIPRNFECTLGKYVKSRCAHLIQGTGQRYSNASAKQIPATMYPANNPEVEGAVLDYCVSKAFRSHRVELS